jgi:hypothetical protein
MNAATSQLLDLLDQVPAKVAALALINVALQNAEGEVDRAASLICDALEEARSISKSTSSAHSSGTHTEHVENNTCIDIAGDSDNERVVDSKRPFEPQRDGMNAGISQQTPHISPNGSSSSLRKRPRLPNEMRCDPACPFYDLMAARAQGNAMADARCEVCENSFRCDAVKIGALNSGDMVTLFKAFMTEPCNELYIMTPFVGVEGAGWLEAFFERVLQCAHVHLCTRKEGLEQCQQLCQIADKGVLLYRGSTFHYKLLAKSMGSSPESPVLVLFTSANVSEHHLSSDERHPYNYDGFAWFCMTKSEFKRLWWNPVSPRPN